MATQRDAVLAWARAAGVYARYGGVPCDAVRAIGHAASSKGIPSEDVEQAYLDGRNTRPSPYWMGWVARILFHDLGARMDMGAPMRELGEFHKTPEYKQGWADAQEASRVILRGLRTADGPAPPDNLWDIVFPELVEEE